MKTVIEMARSVGARPQQNKNCDVEYLMDSEAIERLVELARADEREACAGKVEVFARKWWSIHCGTNKHRDTTRKAHDDFCMLQAMLRARSNT